MTNGPCGASKSKGVNLRLDHFPPILMSRRNDLLSLLATRSAKRGTFTLASGRQSSLYIDARITTMSPDGLALIGPLGVETIAAAGWNADSIGGLTMGADPI